MVENRTLSLEETNRALRSKRIKSKTGKIAAMVFVYFILILMYAPLLYITVYSFTNATTTGSWSGFSMDLYKNLFNYANNAKSQAIWNAARNTLLIAVVSAAISVVLGTLGAIGIYYTRHKWWRST